MRRMIGATDGVHDGLFRFTQPITGSFFWCPPVKGGKLDLSPLINLVLVIDYAFKPRG